MKKLIVITGATKGIGLALARKFAGEGFDLAVCARNEDNLIQLEKTIKRDFPETLFYARATDVSDKKQVHDFIKFVRDLQRPVDVLINNAGIFLPGAIHQEEEGTLEKVISANLFSAYWLTRGFIHEMKANRSGHIFNMCSTASIIPYVNGGSYCISKFGLLGMTKVLREEMKEYDVKVTAIIPGATLTASWEGADLPPERFMKPEDVAEAVFNAFSLSKHSVVEEIIIRPQLGDI